MSRMRLLVAGVALAVVAMGLAPGVSEAQRPVYKGASEDRSSLENAKVVDDSETSYAYYAEMEPGRADVYQVYARQGQVFNPSLRVPQSGDLKTFAPAMALIGPGIGKPASSIPAGELPVKPPTGTGVLIADFAGDSTTRPSVSEPLTFASFWKGQEVNTTYPKDGPYYVVVWDKTNRGGKYVLTLGEKEDFGLFDLIKYPYTWAKQEMWLGNWVPLALAVLVVGALVFLVARLVMRRGRRKA